MFYSSYQSPPFNLSSTNDIMICLGSTIPRERESLKFSSVCQRCYTNASYSTTHNEGSFPTYFVKEASEQERQDESLLSAEESCSYVSAYLNDDHEPTVIYEHFPSAKFSPCNVSRSIISSKVANNCCKVASPSIGIALSTDRPIEFAHCAIYVRTMAGIIAEKSLSHEGRCTGHEDGEKRNFVSFYTERSWSSLNKLEILIDKFWQNSTIDLIIASLCSSNNLKYYIFEILQNKVTYNNSSLSRMIRY